VIAQQKFQCRRPILPNTLGFGFYHHAVIRQCGTGTPQLWRTLDLNGAYAARTVRFHTFIMAKRWYVNVILTGDFQNRITLKTADFYSVYFEIYFFHAKTLIAGKFKNAECVFKTRRMPRAAEGVLPLLQSQSRQLTLPAVSKPFRVLKLTDYINLSKIFM
jgi:hypothetical protein